MKKPQEMKMTPKKEDKPLNKGVTQKMKITLKMKTSPKNEHNYIIVR